MNQSHIKEGVEKRGPSCTVCGNVNGYSHYGEQSSLVAQLVENLPAMRETWVRSLGQEDPLEQEMAVYSGTFAWRIPWTQGPGGL